MNIFIDQNTCLEHIKNSRDIPLVVILINNNKDHIVAIFINNNILYINFNKMPFF
jgi:hypothetical protein